MKDIFDGNPSVTVKKKHVQAVIDHCLDKKIEFIVKPGTSGLEEWIIEFNLDNIKRAVLLGMFLRENRLDLSDVSYKSEKAEKATEKQAEKPAEKPEPVKAQMQPNIEPAKEEVKKSDFKPVNLDSFSFAFGEDEKNGQE